MCKGKTNICFFLFFVHLFIKKSFSFVPTLMAERFIDVFTAFQLDRVSKPRNTSNGPCPSSENQNLNFNSLVFVVKLLENLRGHFQYIMTSKKV